MSTTIAIYALFLVSVAYGAPTDVNGGFTRVVNGTAAPPGRFPFMISLQFDKDHFCGGTILSDKWILTAAHCVVDEVVANLSVVAGILDLNSGGERRQVKQYIPHEEYDPDDNYKHDIAVIELVSGLPISTDGDIQKVTLPTQGQATNGNETGTLAGWGDLYSGGPASDILLMVNLLTYTDEECLRLMLGNIHSSNICAGVPGGGKGQCGGDSGGPLIVNGYQAGIVSWSVRPCASPNYPGIYTEVSHYIDWIKSKTGITI